MNQEQFLARLEQLLSDIPEEERREAMRYYRCYFEDAGAENEASVLEELISPEHVSRTIHEDLEGETSAGGFTERGYEEFREKAVPDVGGSNESYRTDGSMDSATEDGDPYIARQYDDRASRREDDRYGDNRREDNRCRDGRRRRTGGGGLLALVAKIFAVIGVVIALIVVLAVLFCVGAVLLGLVCGFGISAVIMFALASSAAFVMPAGGIACGGVGLILLAVCVLLIPVLVSFCIKAFPAALRRVCNTAGDVILGGRRDGR